MVDIEKTQHFSIHKNIISNLWKDLPDNINIVEPFYGAGDLLKDIPKNKAKTIEIYDIDTSNSNNKNIKQRNTLADPPDYKNKYVITNPPYLAKNKTENKEIYEEYKTDDLYKIAILSFLESSGGILVVPLNFLTDKRTYKIREQFFNRFYIKTINIFEFPIFEYTNIQTVSFSYLLKTNEKTETEINIYKSDNTIRTIKTNINEQGLFYEKYNNYFNNNYNLNLNRITIEYQKKDNEVAIPIVFNLIDKNKNSFKNKKGNIYSFYEKNIFVGSNSIRGHCSFYADKEIVENIDWKQVVEKWNNNIDRFRTETHNISLTNFRDVGRKRLTITECKQLLSKIIKEINNGII